jgi:hypothetical protein
MHRYRAWLAAAVVVGTALLAVTSASAAKHATLKFFFKQAGMTYVGPNGKPLSNSAQPAVGDSFSAFDDLYAGTSSHHAKTYTATAVLDCVITSVVNPNTNIPGRCEGVISLGTSMIVSISTQNLADNSSVTGYPITGGTGVYKGATGVVKTTGVGKSNNSNGVIIIR